MAAPYENSRVAKLVDKRVYELQSRKSQREIATEAGFVQPNMISMIKKGVAKLALDRVVPMARALEVDPAMLFRLALEQYIEGDADVVGEIFGTIVSKNEVGILAVIREASAETDPQLSDEKREALRQLFQPSL